MNIETMRQSVELMGKTLNAATLAHQRGEFCMSRIWHNGTSCGTPACLAGHAIKECKLNITPHIILSFRHGWEQSVQVICETLGIPQKWSMPLFLMFSQFDLEVGPNPAQERLVIDQKLVGGKAFHQAHLDRFRKVYWYMRRKLAIMELEEELGREAPTGQARREWEAQTLQPA